MTRRRLIALAFLAAALLFAFLAYETARIAALPAPSALASFHYGVPIRVSKVIDGDTVELANGARLRYVGIDTPEEFDPRKPVQCYAAEAAAENKRLVEGKDIIVYKDISTRDIYNRYLGFVYLATTSAATSSELFVNAALVREGFAFAYPYKPDISKSAVFAEAEANAREANVGLWSHCEVRTTSSGRKQTNAL